MEAGGVGGAGEGEAEDEGVVGWLVGLGWRLRGHSGWVCFRSGCLGGGGARLVWWSVGEFEG